MKKKFIYIFILIIAFITGSIVYYDYKPFDNVPKLSLKEYTGYEYNKLNDSIIKKLEKMFDEVNMIKVNRHNYQEYLDKINEINRELKLMGVSLPYTDFDTFLEDNKSKFSKNDFNEFKNLNSEIDSLQSEIDSIMISKEVEKMYSDEEKLDQLKKKRGQLMIKYNINPYEISREIDNSQKNYVNIPVNNNSLSIDFKTLKKTDIILYQKLWDEIKLIIPPDYLSYISNLLVFSDGSENTLAYVIQDENSTKWTVAVDLIDSIDYKGNFSRDFIDTLIHEFMHLITLNDSQMDLNIYEFGESYTIDEGSLKPDSYLNEFYNKFWKNHQEQIYLQKRTDYPADEKDYLTQIFYEKHQNEFISEYAATSPEEDISETFMEFVLKNKPDGKEIKYEKIRFLYNYSELVNLRNYIRNNLKENGQLK